MLAEGIVITTAEFLLPFLGNGDGPVKSSKHSALSVTHLAYLAARLTRRCTTLYYVVASFDSQQTFYHWEKIGKRCRL